MMMRKTLIAALLFTAGSASAAVLGTEPFTIDTSAYGGTKVKDIQAVDYSFGLNLDALSTGPFTLAGIGFASSFRTTLASPPVPGTGLGTAYNLYAQIASAGTAVPTGDPSLFIGKYTAFHADVRIDPLLNSLPDGSGQADDVTIWSGDLAQGASVNSIDRATGLFKVLLHTNFTQSPQFKFEYTSQPDVLLTGVFAGDALGTVGSTVFNQEVLGSGNFSAVIPEPSIGLMAGIGALVLLGIRKLKSFV